MTEQQTEDTTETTPPTPAMMLGALCQKALAGRVQQIEIVRDEVTINVAAGDLVAVLETLKVDPELAFTQLIDLCGVDYPARAQRFDVVYHLLSMRHNRRVRVRVIVGEGVLVPSIIALHPAAGWFEREAWDMYGIPFAGNPDLRRILTDYGFEGYPLRKDFPLTGFVEVRYDETQKRVVYEPVKLAQDFRNFDFVSPWEAMTDVQLPGDEKAARPHFWSKE